MKWKNKGQEYEKYNSYFADKKILIYGAGSKGKYLFEKLKALDCVEAFIDNAPEYLNSEFCGKKVIRYRDLKEDYSEKCIIVIAAKMEYTLEFVIQCRKAGFVDGYTLFYWEDFLRYYLDIYSLYHNGKVCADFISLQVSSLCNLRCKGCLAFIPQDKHMHHFSLEDIKKNVDAVFSNIDYIRTLDLCGGEPFCSPVFKDAIEYVGANYGDRIENLRTVTNGTVIPSDELCDIMSKNRMTVLLDDYRDYVELSKKNFDQVYKKLLEHMVDVIVNKVENWINLGIEEGEKIKDENKIIRQFDECNNTRFAIINMKLYACDFAAFASQSMVYPDCNCEYLNLGIKYSKQIVLEFLKGYTDSGSSGMCSFCNGGLGINKCFIGVATQIDGRN